VVEWVWSYSWYVDGRGLLALNLVPVSVLEEPVLPHALDTLQPFAVIRMEQLQVASSVAEVYTRGMYQQHNNYYTHTKLWETKVRT
jgi:hypothetical protein